ncbi:aminotransferase class V [Xylanimonas cellulosilytica DSM 15894]|uniref:Aminotransferase class V n=1 Tax=Xylanimonas cellulosilytica (strain DSM 15894 / JCM 12276 / CECT 5975 / KCTC 9989 / LMG 20990 / NBRC 107835 / XIL07) TaxID=446471 RepID=D1BVB5_XYLCX|nr:cysteine desulfurase family protein [Xylanimonas cellulosilytica]ACZ29386.1 aminotransferase class V [Xylanimonas cellulosilytica DSM 15894]
MLYADAAATTPVRREVLEAMWPYLTGEFGNPSSSHELGHRAAAALTVARATVARTFGARPGEVTFTSGGTEADNLAVKGLALAATDPARGRRARGRHLVTSAIEHEAVLESVDFLRRWHGFEVTVVDLEPDGTVTPDALRGAVRPDTALVTIHHANNEIGTVQDVRALAAVAHEVGALFHTDAVQAAGWLPVSLAGSGADAISVSGHKLGAPKGVGALLVRAGVPVEPLVHGGGQERGRRSGTENVAFAVGLAAAVGALPALQARADDVAASRDALIDGVLTRVPTAILTGPDPRLGGFDRLNHRGEPADLNYRPVGGFDRLNHRGTPVDHNRHPVGGFDRLNHRGAPADHNRHPVVEPVETTRRRLPGHASFCFPGTSGEAVLLELERAGIVTSSGSACAAGRDEPSHVLLALGIDPEIAQTSVRFTLDAPFDAEPLVAAVVEATTTLGRLGT